MVQSAEGLLNLLNTQKPGKSEPPAPPPWRRHAPRVPAGVACAAPSHQIPGDAQGKGSPQRRLGCVAIGGQRPRCEPASAAECALLIDRQSLPPSGACSALDWADEPKQSAQGSIALRGLGQLSGIHLEGLRLTITLNRHRQRLAHLWRPPRQLNLRRSLRDFFPMAVIRSQVLRPAAAAGVPATTSTIKAAFAPGNWHGFRWH